MRNAFNKSSVLLAACVVAFGLSSTHVAAQATTNLGPLQLTVNSPSPTGTTEYLTFFLSLQQGANTSLDWFELPYTTGGARPTIQITDTSGMPLTLSDAGYMLSPTLIPLDSLNINDDPPTGSPGSPFTPLPQYDGTLSAGGSESGAVPDASWTIALLGIAAGSLAAARRHFARA